MELEKPGSPGNDKYSNKKADAPLNIWSAMAAALITALIIAAVIGVAPTEFLIDHFFKVVGAMLMAAAAAMTSLFVSFENGRVELRWPTHRKFIGTSLPCMASAVVAVFALLFWRPIEQAYEIDRLCRDLAHKAEDSEEATVLRAAIEHMKQEVNGSWFSFKTIGDFPCDS